MRGNERTNTMKVRTKDDRKLFEDIYYQSDMT